SQMAREERRYHDLLSRLLDAVRNVIASPSALTQGVRPDGTLVEVPRAIAQQLKIDLENNTVSTSDGGVIWRAVFVRAREYRPVSKAPPPLVDPVGGCRVTWPDRSTQAPPPPPTVRGDFGPLAPKLASAVDLASVYGAKRRTGVKPSKLGAAMEWLLKAHPKGVPADRKNDVLVGDMKADTDILVSIKTMRRAMMEIAKREQGQIADKED